MSLVVPTRRGFLTGLLAAPAVIAANRLMPVRAVEWLSARQPMACYVSSVGGNGIGQLGTRGNPYRTLRDAMLHAVDGDTFTIGASHDETVAGPIVLDRSVAIIGEPGHPTFRTASWNPEKPLFRSQEGVRFVEIRNLFFVTNPRG